MGWTRAPGLRLYFERKDKSYILVDTSCMNLDGSFESVGNVVARSSPNLCTTSCSREYLYTKCRRASWDEMPEEWKAAMATWVVEQPEKHRGLWKL